MPEENEQPKPPKSSHSTLKLFIGLIILAIFIHVIRSCNKPEDADYSSTPVTAPTNTPSAAQDANINEQQKELIKKEACNNLEITHLNQVKAESQTPLYNDQATDDHVAREQGIEAAYEEAKREAGCN